MFLESLLETSAQAKSRRGWATLISFLLETSAIGVLILVPLLYTDALPAVAHWVDNGISVPTGGPPLEKAPAGSTTIRKPHTEIDETGAIRVPTVIPDHPYVPKEPETPEPPGAGNGLYIPGLPLGDGRGNNPVLDNVIRGIAAAKPPEPPPTNKPVIVSHLDEGMITRRVQPIYPPLAIPARIQGAVVLRAIIGRDGTVQRIETVSGHPMLVGAAIAAVRQWRYRPYYLGGHPVEVDTQITVNFILNR